MYSNGQPELGSEVDENLPIFFNKIIKATEKLKSSDLKTITTRSLFTNETNQVKIENWLFKQSNESELLVTNIFADQRTILRKSLVGFEFQSNKNELVQFLATSELDNDLKQNWSNLESIHANQKTAQNASDEDLVTKQRHLKRLQRLGENPALITKPPRKSDVSSLKSSIPVTNNKHTKLDNGKPSISNTSTRLSALQQYLAAVSYKSVQMKQSQLKQSVNK